jgi:hypothetical protein
MRASQISLLTAYLPQQPALHPSQAGPAAQQDFPVPVVLASAAEKPVAASAMRTRRARTRREFFMEYEVLIKS